MSVSEEAHTILSSPNLVAAENTLYVDKAFDTKCLPIGVDVRRRDGS